MQIALITDGIWPYVLGGMQKHSFYLCKYLAQNKVNIHLFHYNKSNFDINKLEFFSDEERKYIQSSIVDFPKSGYFPGNYLYNSYKHSRLIFEIIKPTLSNYDFIYTKGFTGWYLINQKKIKSISCPPIGVKFHGYEMFQPSPNFKTKLQNVFLLQGIVKSISKNADYVFSYGGKISEIVKSLGISPSKIIELPSAVELKIVSDNIQPTSENIKFLFLGRYERRKGIEELNFAIDLFFKLNPNSNCEFNFIGLILTLIKLLRSYLPKSLVCLLVNLTSKSGLELVLSLRSVNDGLGHFWFVLIKFHKLGKIELGLLEDLSLSDQNIFKREDF